MNWLKLEEKYPKSYKELRVLNEMTGKIGADLLDEYFMLYNKDCYLMRLPVLQEIEDSLK